MVRSLARPASSFSLFALAAAAVLAVWGLLCLQGALAYGDGGPGTGLGILMALLGCGAWVVVEEPELAPGGAQSLGRLLLGLLLLGAGEAILHPEVAGKERWAPLGFALLASGALALWPRKALWSRRIALAAALGLALVGFGTALVWKEAPFDLFAGPPQGSPSAIAFWALLGTAFASLAWGAWFAEPNRPVPERPLNRAWEWGLLALILALAAGLRFYRAGQIPEGFWYDEVNLTRAVQDLLQPGTSAPLYVADQVENPGAYLWVGAALFRVFGVHIQVLRILAGAFGVLALLPFWGLSRLWFGKRWALASTLTFGCMYWVLIPQRIAFMSGFALFWMLAAFWALWSARLRGGWPRWLLAGLTLGANLHTYTPARVVPLVVCAFLGWEAVLDAVARSGWKKGASFGPDGRHSWKPWAAFLAGFLLVSGPMFWWIAGNWTDYLHRSQEVSIFSDVAHSGKALLPELWGSFAKHLLMFQYRGDFNARHNIHFLPHADLILAAALGLAFPWTLGRTRQDPRARFLWIWFGAMLAAGIFSMPVEAPQGHRTILAAPILPLAAAWALKDLLAPYGSAFKAGWPLAAWAVVLALLGGVFFLNAHAVLTVWAPSEATFRSFSPRASAVAKRIEETGPGTAVYLSSLPKEYIFNGYEWEAFARQTLRQEGRSYANLTASQPVPTEADGRAVGRVLLIWGESDEDLTRAFGDEFPGVAVEKAPQPFPGGGEPDFLYLAAEVPLASVPEQPLKGPLPLIYRFRPEQARTRDSQGRAAPNLTNIRKGPVGVLKTARKIADGSLKRLPNSDDFRRPH